MKYKSSSKIVSDSHKEAATELCKIGYLTANTWLKIILICLFFTPSIWIVEGLPAVRLEELALAALLLCLLIRWAVGREQIAAWGLRQSLLAGFPIFIVMSIFVGMYSGYASSLGDLNQLIRLAKYGLIYTIALTIIRTSPDSDAERLQILKFISLSSIFTVIIVLQQYFNIFDLNELYIPLVAPTQYESLIDNYPRPRPVGMIGNPNRLGFLFAVSTLISIYILITASFNLLYIFSLFIQMSILLSTQSRGALIAFFAGMIYLIVILNIRKKTRSDITFFRSSVVMFLIFLLTYIFLFGPGISDLMGARVAGLDALESDSSWQTRLKNWRENIALFRESPVFGVGPLRRAHIQYAADNEWLLLLRSYGLVGTLFLLAAIVLPHFVGARTDVGVLVGAILISTAIYMIPAAVFHSLVLMPLVLIVLALGDTTGNVLTLRIGRGVWPRLRT